MILICRWFLIIVLAVGILTTLSLALSIAYVVESFANASTFNNQLNKTNKNSRKSITRMNAVALTLDGVRGIAIASVVVLIPLVGLIYQLCGFHGLLSRFHILKYFLNTLYCSFIKRLFFYTNICILLYLIL